MVRQQHERPCKAPAGVDPHLALRGFAGVSAPLDACCAAAYSLFAAAAAAVQAGMFPDVAERLALAHLAKGDQMSALITGGCRC